jgi:hypothetical protein
MNTIVYTLKKDEGTGELHLFEAEVSAKDPSKCTPKPKSICEKMNKDQSIKNIFACKDEQVARELCAKLGRKVCGTCVSNLYATVV